MRYSIHTDKQKNAMVLKKSKVYLKERLCVCADEVWAVWIDTCENIHLFVAFNLRRISTVGRALDCSAGGRGFDSRGRANTQGLNITEKWRYSLLSAVG